MQQRGGRGSTALVGLLVASGLLFLLWSAASGPVGVLGGSHDRMTTVPQEAPTESPGPDPIQEQKDAVVRTHDLGFIGEGLAYLVLGLIIAAILGGLVLAWRHRWHPPARPPDLDFDVLPADRAADALREGADDLMSSLRDGEARNAIVRCWLSLEERIGGSGLPRQRFETSTEYVVRVLHALDLDPRAIGSLAALYREARFSTHELGEQERAAATSALSTLLHQLAGAGWRR